MKDSVRRFGDFLISLGLVTRGQVDQALALQPLTGNRVGESLLSLGFLTREQLQRALSLAVRDGDTGVLERPPLGEVLQGLRYITQPQLDEALAAQQKSGRRLGELLVEHGALTHRQLYEALGLQHRMSVGESKPQPAPAATRATKLLVIDDSELALALVEEGLSNQGYEVVCFSDPFLALEQADSVRPDVVMTDLTMPGVDGVEVCRLLKGGPRGEVPVIILTGSDDEAAQLQGGGADDYVNKGASMEELSARVDAVLRRKREADSVRQLFAGAVSDVVVDELLRGGEVVLSGEERFVTVLVAGVRGFTDFAQLNLALERLAEVVLEGHGTLAAVQGDGLMAVWGAPVTRDDDALLATGAAARMLEEIAALNVQLSIGLHSGPVLAGRLGPSRRAAYTCIGEAVQLASAWCAQAAPGEVLLGESTAQAVQDTVALTALPPEPVPLFPLAGR